MHKKKQDIRDEVRRLSERVGRIEGKFKLPHLLVFDEVGLAASEKDLFVAEPSVIERLKKRISRIATDPHPGYNPPPPESKKPNANAEPSSQVRQAFSSSAEPIFCAECGYKQAAGMTFERLLPGGVWRCRPCHKKFMVRKGSTITCGECGRYDAKERRCPLCGTCKTIPDSRTGVHLESQTCPSWTPKSAPPPAPTIRVGDWVRVSPSSGGVFYGVVNRIFEQRQVWIGTCSWMIEWCEPAIGRDRNGTPIFEGDRVKGFEDGLLYDAKVIKSELHRGLATFILFARKEMLK
jgi:hypothetical protein